LHGGIVATMLLRTGLATAALTLLLATTASADATQRVLNGGFEDGTGVQDNSTTSLSARATNLAGDSGCSNSLTYVELGQVELGTPPVARPATGLSSLRSRFVVGRLGVLTLGKGVNAPVFATTQKLTIGAAGSSASAARLRVIGHGRTAIPAGTTKKMKLTLNQKGKRLLRKRRKLRAQLTIVAKRPTGLTDTVTRTVRLRLKRR
jgi:hypothetical protein